MNITEICKTIGIGLVGVIAVAVPLNLLLLMNGQPEGAFGLIASAATLFAIAKIFQFAGSSKLEGRQLR